MNAIFVNYPNQLVSTRDGGSSFTVSSLPDDNLADVFFVDSTTAYAAGANIWKTTDAGINWTKIYGFGPGSSYCTLYFINPQTGWYLSRYFGLNKTADSGVTWQSVPAQFDNINNQAVFFLNADTGYVSSGLYVERTTDGGASWTKIFTGGSAYIYRDIRFVSDKTGYITDYTHIDKTQDGGNTWSSDVSLLSNQLFALYFTDPNHGWACGSKGTILIYNP